MMRAGAVVLLLVFLTACATGNPRTDALTAVGVSCDAYATSLDTLLTRGKLGKLSADQKAQVNEVRVFITPLCKADPASLVDPLSVVDSIKRHMKQLIFLEEVTK